ncbi:MAG: cell division protein FtsZ [Thiotrichales bacterium]|nr:cell division protein FtsZ [Thiotrichales bacterium]MCY4286916.1 cell division protein FtsZ [Thiotrichales bacterium]MCY4348411.1 cell division protein FtsZ [Thiotrichales bacterium]
MFELVENSNNAVIRVIGVGGGGGNAVEHMVANDVEGVEFVCVNTDAQALKNNAVRTVLQLGTNVTKGLGAGANPEIGRQAALEDRERLVDLLEGSDMVFITAGMGGGTGTGASPVIAQIAREMGILTVAVVTRPFPFELRRRMTIAQEGITELSEHVDSLITIPNEKLLSVLGERVTLKEAFAAANDVLLGAVQGIAELITRPGMINVDFADVRTVMSEKGRAMMGTGRGSGEDGAQKAAETAMRCPLLENINLSGARGILVNITGSSSLGMHELHAVGDSIGEFASENALVVMGTALDESVGDEVRVTVVATGLGDSARPAPVQPVRLVPAEPEPAPEPAPAPAPENPALGGTSGSDYRRYEVPTIIRKQPERQEHLQMFEEDSDYQKIPVFLRKQLD